MERLIRCAALVIGISVVSALAEDVTEQTNGKVAGVAEQSSGEKASVTEQSTDGAGGISEQTLREADAEQMRIIVEGDAKAQASFMHDNYILNGPSGKVLRKPVLVEMLAQGKMASERFERVIEGIAITGKVGIVMGREVVKPSPGSELGKKYGSRELNRRFTNVFLFEKGRWYFLARQATVMG